MTRFTVIALALSFCALTFAGCSTASRPGCCGCMEGNLCGWNFYKPADLVEGQAVNGCRDLCAQPCCEPGVVLTQETLAPVVPAEAAAPDGADAAADVAAEEAPAEGAVSEFGEPAEAR